MANRDALRQFQSLLASRLQAARVSGVAASWLAVQAGGANYLFPLSQAGEIFPWRNVQRVPYTRDWFLGVTNLRGGMYGVADLQRFIASERDLPALPAPVVGSSREQSLVAFGQVLDTNCALLVDRLVGLRGVEAFTASSAATPGAAPFYGSRYTDAAGTEWQELNLQLLSQHPSFLSISA